MKSTAMLGWMQAHQQQLIAALVAMVLVIVGISMWMQQQASMRESASVLYQKALDSKDNGDKKALLDQVVREYGGTAYAPFSLLLLAGLDRDRATEHLQSLLAHSGLTAELRAQASLDLAGLYMKAGNDQKAMSLLSEMPVGSGYEQLRHFMMAEASAGNGQKIKHYQRALDAKSLDTKLKSEIEAKLKHLRAESLTGS